MKNIDWSFLNAMKTKEIKEAGDNQDVGDFIVREGKPIPCCFGAKLAFALCSGIDNFRGGQNKFFSLLGLDYKNLLDHPVISKLFSKAGIVYENQDPFGDQKWLVSHNEAIMRLEKIKKLPKVSSKEANDYFAYNF